MDKYDEDDLEIDLGFDTLDTSAEDAAQAAGTAAQNEPLPAQPHTSALSLAQPLRPRPPSQLTIPNSDQADDSNPTVPAPSTTEGPAPPAGPRDGFGCIVYVSGMDWWITDVELEKICQQYGTVVSLKFFEDRSNGKSAGSCAVEFSSNAEAKACIEKLNGSKIGEKVVQTAWPGKGRFFRPRPPTEAEPVPDAAALGAGRGRGRGRGFGAPEAPMMPMMRPGMGMMNMGDPMAMGMMGPMIGPMGPMMGHMGPIGPMMRPNMGMSIDGPDRKRLRS